MGNKGATGPFAPLVVVVRNIVGEKEFNKIRGKAISLHSQGERWPPASRGNGARGRVCVVLERAAEAGRARARACLGPRAAWPRLP